MNSMAVTISQNKGKGPTSPDLTAALPLTLSRSLQLGVMHTQTQGASNQDQIPHLTHSTE